MKSCILEKEEYKITITWEDLELIIRSAVLEDAERLSDIYAYYVKYTAISFEYDAPSADAFRRRMEDTLKSFPYLVLEENDIPQAYIYAGPLKTRAAYSRCCELSIYADKAARGRGYGKLLYQTMQEELAKRGFLNLYACIASPIGEDPFLTRDSEYFHEHIGFVKVAEFHRCGYKFGRWYDTIWMEKLIGSHQNKKTGENEE